MAPRVRTDDPSFRAMRGRIGAHVLHARHDARETTRAARAAFLGKFLREVDPNGELSEAERLRRAEHARKAYFAKLALASARARAEKKQRASARTAGGA